MEVRNQNFAKGGLDPKAEICLRFTDGIWEWNPHSPQR